jgi:hypothetical protein
MNPLLTERNRCSQATNAAAHHDDFFVFAAHVQNS